MKVLVDAMEAVLKGFFQDKEVAAKIEQVIPMPPRCHIFCAETAIARNPGGGR